jgi:hypothetical protein
MKAAVLIVCSFIFIVLVTYLILNQKVINSYDGPIFSDSKSLSKQLGYYSCDYKPSRDFLILRNCTIPSPSLWSENSQELSHTQVFNKQVNEETSSFNFIIDSLAQCNKALYIAKFPFSVQGLNCIRGLGFVYLAQEEPDTILLRFEQGSPLKGWEEPIQVDSIYYFKVKNAADVP